LIIFPRRTYLGEAGSEIKSLSVDEEALLKTAKPKAEEIFRRHVAIPVDSIETRQRRLIYRSKQRGWLEGTCRQFIKKGIFIYYYC
jgi:hypothetical protein